MAGHAQPRPVGPSAGNCSSGCALAVVPKPVGASGRGSRHRHRGADRLHALPPIDRWANVRVLFQRVNVLPTPSPRPSGPLGERLGLGQLTTLSEAQAHLAWQITVPSSLGRPEEVSLHPPPVGAAQGEVTLVYSTRRGIRVAGQTGVAVLVT